MTCPDRRSCYVIKRQCIIGGSSLSPMRGNYMLSFGCAASASWCSGVSFVAAGISFSRATFATGGHYDVETFFFVRLAMLVLAKLGAN